MRPEDGAGAGHCRTVFLIDDDASVRDALTLQLSLHGHACAAFCGAEDFLASLQPHWRGCVVADLRMPGLTGLQLQALLRERGSPLPFIVITAHGDVAAARQAFRAGAVDFLEKPFHGEQLLQAVDAALARLPAPVAEPLAPEAAAAGEARAAAALSPREREVMALLVKGLPNRRVAETLGISHRTVEVHKARVLDKLGVRSVIELVRLVDRPGDG